MDKVDFSRLTTEQIENVREEALQALLIEARTRIDEGHTLTYDKHSSSHTKNDD